MNPEFISGPLKFAYSGGPPVLNTGDLRFRSGEITVIAGENGSGKTTLLKLLAGLLVTDGGVSLAEESVYLHQIPYLFRGTVERNLRLASPESGDTERSKVLAAVGLTGFEKRKVKQLSGGESKRVALARAFLSEKPIVLLDEPAAHVDAVSIRKIEGACRSLADSGRAVLVTSHRGSFGYRIADRIVELKDGIIAETHTNLLKGRSVRQDDGHMYFRSGSLEMRAPLRDGSYEVAVIPAEEILLSQNPLVSSARNCFPGTVVSITPRNGDEVVVRVDCGAELSVILTQTSAEELGLETGKSTYVTFKASSVALH